MGSLQTAGNMAKALIGIRDEAMIQAKVAELQSAILAAQSGALTAQSEQFAMLNRVRNLEEQVRQLEAWEREKERYELTALENGRGFVYTLKVSAQGGEPPHQICANCYNRGEKSTLQPAQRDVGRARTLDCHNCGAVIYTSGVVHKEHGPITIKSRR
jgi:translation initiation factor 2B subunit (eIF-2B alpha/beta/delta family)